MEQYIPKDALVAEIENLKNTYKECPTRNSYEEGLKEGRLIGYKDALHKIDTLEVKETDLEEASKNYALNNTPWDDCKDEIQESFKAGAQWQKAKDESVPKDLGEYINELSKQFPEVSFAKLSRIAVRVAKWQKQQDQSTIELAEDHAMLAGMEKMKEQMMAKAIDGEVLENYDGKVLKYDDSILDEKLSNFKVFDKVKIIVIKEN